MSALLSRMPGWHSLTSARHGVNWLGPRPRIDGIAFTIATKYKPNPQTGRRLACADETCSKPLQLVEGHQVEKAALIWSLTLRERLHFHDKEPVLARDVVASIRRFAARISF